MALSVYSLEGKRALITGGGTGIGLGIAQAMVEAGAKVVITGRREAVLQEAVAQLGSHATYRVNDITDKKAIPGLVEDIESNEGPIDILVNNAGIHHKAMAQDTSDEDFERVLQTNVVSVFALTRACAKYMLQRKQGAILMIGSMAGLFGVDKVVAYGTSKTALTGLVNSLVTEYSTSNVRVNAIAPGWIESNMFLNAINKDEKRKQQITNRIAMDCFGQPSDIGNAAVFLSSEAARYITGVVLPVDGGATVNF
ncbi:SDR family NAD(P)-dependent oxidoreductase [Marinoscillum furvescens]|uniref:Gluconate 5-dehydrogenase n=1 Tax=Marinoscillum furvescens DSM 4134 TaxID=1122208 RepID=A0A3D9L025_MARFU|nr:SDR family oxidoreductase [Marinoscillum furvescens]RED96547.1 gluconate 5-dehydrogenase [Marinoscillum furvescens DSM 4134]